MTFSRSVIEYYLLTAEHVLGDLGYISTLSLGNIRKVVQIILPRILWSLTSRMLEVVRDCKHFLSETGVGGGRGGLCNYD